MLPNSSSLGISRKVQQK
jgi:hypothetical protein